MAQPGGHEQWRREDPPQVGVVWPASLLDSRGHTRNAKSDSLCNSSYCCCTSTDCEALSDLVSLVPKVFGLVNSTLVPLAKLCVCVEGKDPILGRSVAPTDCEESCLEKAGLQSPLCRHGARGSRLSALGN
eukprot:2143620-Amphidinium_carterae.1